VSNEIIIFNRWRDLVYRAKAYKNDWDGASVPSGTYFYLLKVQDEDGKTHEFKGFINVLKESLR